MQRKIDIFVRDIVNYWTMFPLSVIMPFNRFAQTLPTEPGSCLT